MEIVKIDEKQDGSAVITMDLTKDEIVFLLEYAVNDILKKRLEKENCLTTC